MRWQYVLAVSALDKYIHDIVRSGILDEYCGRKATTKKFDSISLDMKTLTNINNALSPETEFDNEIARQLGFKAFQDPEKISDALSFIWDESHKWKVICLNMSQSPTPKEEDVKTKLKLIVNRRNQIVHQGDYLSLNFPLQQTSINLSDTIDVIEFIKDVVNAVEKSVT